MAVEVRIEGVRKRFGAKEVLGGIDLAIAPGEIFFLLGPSGCGKTTLLRAVAGLNPPEEGRILVGGKEVTRLPAHKRGMGMVFQSYALWPHMTLLENVLFGLEMRKVPRAEAVRRARAALETVKLGDRASARPNELSGGQQQRVALARALVVEPTCLLLDEPLSNLDAALRLEMRGEIRRLCKAAGLTAIYVTHDQKEALSIADRLAVLESGRVLQVGPPEEVYRAPKSAFVANFIGETTLVPGTVKSVSPGKVAVETAAGVFSAVAEGFAAGEKVVLSIRPEAVRLHVEAAGENTFAATLAGSQYLGEMAQHEAALAGDLRLKALELRPKAVARDAEKVATRIRVPADEIVVLRA
ncbi:MAG: ABC transporter ATP-binding protein [Kiritimatiellae bacterium]|nr:ABC transporter ATP-binding protein [Kiritimatiellia bacterium]